MPATSGGRSAPAARSGRGRVLLPTLVVLAVLVGGFLLFASFYSDWLWFASLDKTSVFTTQLVTRIVLFLVFGLVLATAVGLNMWIAWRTRPVFRGLSPEQASLERYRIAIEPFRRVALIIVPLTFGLLTGMSAAAEWRTWLLWRNATPFGTTDPQFGMDIGFYTFTLPFIRFLLGFFFAVVVLSFLAAVVVHYLYGGLRLQAAGERATPAAQSHLSVLIGVFLLLKSVSYWVDRYELAVKNETLVQGFTGLKYADVNALLPAKNILTFIALLCAILFFVNAFWRTWALPLAGLGLMILSAILIGWLYPAVVQYFQVRPSELVRERDYIARNIDATRTAYGLDEVQVEDYAGNDKAPANVITQEAGTLRNIRLLDPAIVSPTFKQLQQIRGFYSFPEALDIDRYPTENGPRGTVVAVREINLDGVPEGQRNWTNDKTVYTHGFAMVAAADNTATSDGQPKFVESDIPPTGTLDITEPRIYFGEQSPPYSIVGAPEGSEPRELDFPDDTSPNGQRNNTYSGQGGVPVGSLLNKLVFATKFQDTNILLSDLVNPESRIMWERAPRDRVAEVAPWLTLDGDPYPATINGRIVWIIDGYTISNDYPYSSRTLLSDATGDSITARTSAVVAQPRDQINYMRNSVKATVDAYEGTVTLYAWDETDPVLKTWEKAFPDVVQPKSSIPETLMSHLRYPEDIFKVQREILSKYHVTDPEAFYSGQDFWIVPNDPTKRAANEAQPPYYLILQMPGLSKPSYSLTTTFAPSKRQTLASFMAVNSEPGPDYGTIRVLQLPRNTTIPGPSQVQNNFESNQAISSALTLLRGRGSDVVFGNLLSLPVGGGMLYVEPVYVQANGEQGYPLLRKVLAGYGATVAFEDTVDEALAKVFASSGTTPPTPTPNPTPSPSPTPNASGSPSPAPTGDAAAQLAAALADAQAAYTAGQAALAKGDFAAYGQAQDALGAALDRAAAAQRRLGVTPSPTPAGTPSPSLLPPATNPPTTGPTVGTPESPAPTPRPASA